MAMKPNRVSYAAKYSVGVKAPNAHAVTCEFAWQAEDVVAREKGRRENMVDGASITKMRHGQPMQRWVFDAEDVVWRSVYTRNAKMRGPLTAEQRAILVKLDEDLEDLGFSGQLDDPLAKGWDDDLGEFMRSGRQDVFGFHFRHVGEEEDREIYEQAERLWEAAHDKLLALPQKNGRRSGAPGAKRYVLVEYEFDRAAGRYKRESEEPIRLQDFVDDNAHDEEIMDEMKKIHALPVGGEVRFGGGAAPLTAIRRVS